MFAVCGKSAAEMPRAPSAGAGGGQAPGSGPRRSHSPVEARSVLGLAHDPDDDFPCNFGRRPSSLEK